MLSKASIEKILKKAGAERVSPEASKALADYLEEIAFKISIKAVKLAKHAGRKTVREEDIKLAKL
jgi:histone H3/H4